MAKKKTIINRELSWLSFNERVLQESADHSLPLIERIKFLGIFSNNLDEFFKVRVATLKRMIDFSKKVRIPNEENPKTILNKIQDIVLGLQERFDKIFYELISELEKENIFIINELQLNDIQKKFIEEYYYEKISSVLAPIMLQNLKSFPYLKDKSIYFAVKLECKSDENVKTEYSLVEIPTGILPRFIVLPSGDEKKYIILLDDVIRHCLDKVYHIFPFDTFSAYTIKMTRDAELDIDNDLSVSFLDKISKSVKDRSKGQPVRFVYDSAIPKDMMKYLTAKMKLDKDDNLIAGARYHNFKDFMGFPNIGGKHLENPPAPPLKYPSIKPDSSIISVIAKGDFMLHYPYHKFSHFIDLLREAAIDPKVKAIKVTIYRTAKNSKVINALINAARNGKEVIVVIELQARFDESANVYWSKKLEEAGAKVLFGVRGLKVHAKLVLISRMEKRKVVVYGSISTGNFHEDNASVYSDISLFTKDTRITSEIEKVFDFIENTFKTYNYKHLFVSPLYMRRRFYNLIDNEIKNALVGKNAYIIVKINNLIDPEMVKKLYQANNAGVKIKLIVRGTCSIVPGVKGFSENIEAFSIVDRYLEHSRIFVFCNNNKELYYISSADWMTRNLDHRIEVACPIFDPLIQKELRTIIDMQLKDNVKCRILNASQDNTYKVDDTGKKFRSQAELYKYYQSTTGDDVVSNH
jgi:polyphosphate kinase